VVVGAPGDRSRPVAVGRASARRSGGGGGAGGGAHALWVQAQNSDIFFPFTKFEVATGYQTTVYVLRITL